MNPTHLKFLRHAAGALLCAATLQVGAQAEHSYEAWRSNYNEATQAGQNAKATVVDARGNVYVTGYAGVQNSNTLFYTAKYDALDGHVIWSRTYGSGFGDNFANDIAIDAMATSLSPAAPPTAEVTSIT